MSITSAIQNHLQAEAEEIGAALRDVDNGDWKQAETLAKNRYDKRFGTRARSDTATEAIAALKPIFAKDWVKPKNGQSPPPPPRRKMAAQHSTGQHLEEGTDATLDEILFSAIWEKFGDNDVVTRSS